MDVVDPLGPGLSDGLSPPTAKAMVQYLLDPNRNQRPTASQSLSHHWLQTRRPILEKLYDKLLRKSNWTPSSPESEGTVMPLAPATPGPGKQATPRTVRTLGQASQVSVGVIPATPCPQAQEGATTAKRPRGLPSTAHRMRFVSKECDPQENRKRPTEPRAPPKWRDSKRSGVDRPNDQVSYVFHSLLSVIANF